jgi:VWFA-related protein
MRYNPLQHLSLCVLLIMGLTQPWIQAQQSSQNPPAPTKPTTTQKTQQQEDDEPIDLSSRLVNVFFSVQDKRNALITDLRQEDTQIFENGQPQEMFTFSRQTDLPLTIALLLDISGSMEYVLPEEKAAASRFFRTMVRPMKDSVAIAEFRDETILVQDFTSSMERLDRALASVRFTPRTSNDSTSKFGGTSLYDAVYITSQDLLARQPGRHTIILMTDGEDSTSRYKLGDAIDRALRSETTVYAIGIGDRYRFGVNEGVLKKLSNETGGRAYFPDNAEQLEAAFRQIEDELRSQYLIAYYPSNASQDGSFRKIEIRTPNRKDLRFRHRLGYYAAKADK